MADTREINLYGRILITGYIRAVTGLHIGKGKEGVTVGGVDNPVMRDMLTNEPYIPGSSLKGKLRSLAEKCETDLQPNFPIKGDEICIHICGDRTCPVCRIYGVPGQQKSSAPTRLIVRDVFLTEDSKNRLRAADTDQPYTEVKYEAAIDRVTSAANPRPLERVPADSIFGPFEMVFNVYEQGDLALLNKLIETMRILEDDYLGGSGSRGSGKIKFEKVTITSKPVNKYMELSPALTCVEAGDLEGLLIKKQELDKLLAEIQVPTPAAPAAKEEPVGNP